MAMPKAAARETGEATMADHTGIEWTDATWNPIVGCSVVSPGCTNCYAMPMARRIEAMQPGSHYAGTTKVVNGKAVWTGKVALAPDHILTQPLRWRRPRKIFVNSMGDLFHEDVPDAWLDRVFAVMNASPWHTYQVLTKRPDRMRAYLCDEATNDRVADAQVALGLGVHVNNPSRHIWLGTSVENQKTANDRRRDLAALAADRWKTFASYEPALGPVDWSGWEFLSWLISGGESGSRWRPSHPDWHRATLNFCGEHRIPYFFKQWGSWAPRRAAALEDLFDTRKTLIVRHDGGTTSGLMAYDETAWVMDRVGKRTAGRLLDGIEHNGMPEVQP